MFDGHYLDWNQKRIKAILDHYGHQFLSGKKILDLGSGHGDVAGALQRLGADLTAVDGRPEHLQMIIKKYPGVKVIKADLDRDWQFQKKKFDIIIDMGLLCHLNNYESHLRDICSSCTHLVLETAVCDSADPHKQFLNVENKNIYDLSVNGVGCKPSASAVERVLAECGFSFQRVSGNLNTNTFKYDWMESNNDACLPFQRRMWFATKDQKAIPIAKNTPTKNTPISHKPFVDPRLANPPTDQYQIAPGKKLKTALCISGHLRTFEDNYQSVKEKILDRTDCDVFIHTWDVMGIQHRFTDNKVYSLETKQMMDKIHQLYKPKKMVVEKSRHFLVSPIMHQRLVDHRDIPGMLSMFYKVEACNQLKSQYEKEYSFIYDCVIRFRGDLWVETPFPADNTSNLNRVFLPIYGNFGGACDQFAYGSSLQMDIYCSLYSNIEKYLFAGAPFNPEKLLQYHLDYSKASITKVNFKYLIKRSNGLIQDNMLLERALGFIR